MKAKQLPMAAIVGADPGIFLGGVGPNFGSERTVELFLWQVTSPPHSLPPVAVAQIIGGCPKQLDFSISLEFSLVVKCNSRFIKRKSASLKLIYDPVDVRISVSNKHQV